MKSGVSQVYGDLVHIAGLARDENLVQVQSTCSLVVQIDQLNTYYNQQ